MARSLWFKTLFICLILSLAWACAPPPAPAPPAYFYLTPPLTYLRDGPNFQGNVLAQLYRGDQVERLGAGEGEGGWWRVRATRSGQTGWVQGELLSPNPVPMRQLYVAVTTVPLRECPEETCATLQLLYGGDRVQELEENHQGWVRALAEKGRTLGWLPKGVLAEKPPTAQPRRPEKPYAYVAVPRLKLRLQPSPQAPVVQLLALNDQVERLEVNAGGWVKVHQRTSGATGWVPGRYLQDLPVKARPAPAKKKKPRAPEKPEKKEGEPPELEVM